MVGAMNVIVFGASGGTGRELVKQLLAAGHAVTAFVRNVESIPLAPRLTIMQGDVLGAPEVASAIAAGPHDAVMTALGSRSLAEGDLLDRSSANIIAGMKAAGVRRLVVLGAAGALHDSGKYATAARRLFFKVLKGTLLKNPLQDSAAQERRVEASDLEYTVVHPPRLHDGPRTGRYRVMADGLPPAGDRIARADVADFMVKQLTDAQFVRRGPYIAD